ncbi:MAG: ribonuclease H-like YkuK family protein [Clostridia bacterium]|nr:ribonuclease H-like YkuK family protein [Clostridia bacterium]MDQ7791842.1 ribonuclease H-like YkuK family protein [Clostridia bacterium]
MFLTSPTKGKLTFAETIAEIMEFITGLPTSSYKIIIGSDSQVMKGSTCFITAIIVHRLGKGARYFYRKKTHRKIKSLRQKIFFETALSLEMGGMVAKEFSDRGTTDDFKVEIHIDVGNYGETKDLIREVVGMVTGSGFCARIKPEAFGASSVADRHTK